MTFWRALHRFNAVIIALVGVGLVLMLAFGLLELVRAEGERRGVVSSSSGSEPYDPGSGFIGDVIAAEGRTLVLYARKDGANLRDAYFLDTASGAVTPFPVRAGQTLQAGETVRDSDDAPGYGQFALAITPGKDGPERVDAMFVRFSDMKIATVVANQSAIDGPYRVGAHRFSLVVWTADGQARFLVYDADQGAITVARDLPMKERGEKPGDRAPISKFH